MRAIAAAVLCAALGTEAAPLQRGAAASSECAAQYAAHLESDLALSYEAFDQTEGAGFRPLAALGCNREAADLIEAWMRANDATERSLRWHVAQLRASAGQTAEAVRHARGVLADDEDFAKNALRWNDYVRATIAFLERDRAALLRHRDAVAAGKDAHYGNALNLRLLDSLVRHFDRDYAYATAHIGD